jgi:hypothetical protein
MTRLDDLGGLRGEGGRLWTEILYAWVEGAPGAMRKSQMFHFAGCPNSRFAD